MRLQVTLSDKVAKKLSQEAKKKALSVDELLEVLLKREFRL